ncbi:hypothetical protein BTR22_06440 [Alkalihalophilus pseudofirmus]|uniref:hypothetical protein n=1 Tax=Alkalihalophilus pseudofirmus TaxID=79885 RepID=UPI00095234A6|nr:hypothetical protein [Alkalihalophilus pseudofirmus]OLS38133.1 hypothetical protein BTR22_06440 [Alkalihalophilus pseudofirmus]WEG18778.1 hypothetical protein PQ478_09910 [Alkalihalophilus pseudofirmus]
MFSQKKTLEEIKNKGKWHFILTEGVLSWGITTAVLFYLFMNFIEHGMNFSMYITDGWIIDFASILFAFLIGGLLFGWVMWKLVERKLPKD